MGVRELVWLAMGLLLAYVAFELWRALRAGRAAGTGANGGDGFQSGLEVARLAREVEALRVELAAQQQVLADQGGRLEALTAVVHAHKAQQDAAAAVPPVSPEYDEALVFARRGLGVEAIAERCGITVAEAELVCSLARRGAQGTGQ